MVSLSALDLVIFSSWCNIFLVYVVIIIIFVPSKRNNNLNINIMRNLKLTTIVLLSTILGFSFIILSAHALLYVLTDMLTDSSHLIIAKGGIFALITIIYSKVNGVMAEAYHNLY